MNDRPVRFTEVGTGFRKATVVDNADFCDELLRVARAFGEVAVWG